MIYELSVESTTIRINKIYLINLCQRYYYIAAFTVSNQSREALLLVSPSNSLFTWSINFMEIRVTASPKQSDMWLWEELIQDDYECGHAQYSKDCWFRFSWWKPSALFIFLDLWRWQMQQWVVIFFKSLLYSKKIKSIIFVIDIFKYLN